MSTRPEKDTVTGKSTTGQEWDGIKELDTPLPKWWLYVFYVTIAISAVWYVLFPAIPYGTGHTNGLLGTTTRGELAEHIAEAQSAREAQLTEIAATDLPDLQNRPDLLAFAVQGGEAIFSDNCAGCHALGGAGQHGYPTLADDDWLWGGTYPEIYQTIWHGVRNADEDSRNSEMPGFGDILSKEEVAAAATYVQSLNEGMDAAEKASPEGARVFAENCTACHGEKGDGDQTIGAPRLNDQIWLYGGDFASIRNQIHGPHHGVMPAWGPRLGDVGVKMAAAYVYNLGGGKQEAPTQ
ncbi:MAG: cytochrome-c oxidase, cbb3-type subunit III [Geminicoccaceae bacterium]|nr:cytochrome-c oxidase, cbb3-type subunit III [Geminicoccaceae bacterium]